jgi:DNA-binding transcriptional regulator YhcF (GntR family)
LEHTPEQQQKQGQILRELFDLPVVFVLNKLEPWERKRLIERHIAFVQPGRQLYIPDILLDLSDVKLTYRNDNILKAQLSFPAQLAVLYHLEIHPIENLLLRDIAAELGYSTMTISRIARELEQHQLITLEGVKEKKVFFNQKTPRQQWEKAKRLMNSPIRDIWYTDQIPKDHKDFLKSNDTALTIYSMINEGKKTSYAIGKNHFRNLTAHGQLDFNRYFGKFRIEVWHYNPGPLSKTDVVDPLSLYLSMQEDEDERVQMALEEMIKEIKW